VGVEERPPVVDARTRFGDWEGDSIVGKGSAATVTLLERKSGYVLIRKAPRSTAALSCEVLKHMLSVVDSRHTVTLDNDREFSHREQVSEALDCKICFAHPYHRWERGANENVNGLIRQYFPKRKDFDEVTAEQMQAVEQASNLRPRKRLGFRAPIEFIDQLINFPDGCAVNA